MVYPIEDIRYVESAFNQFYDIGVTETGGVTRLGYTKEEDDMHEVFTGLARELGFDIHTDEVGNTFVANSADDEDYYLIGSHLDSVVDGGRYDGVAGVLAGIMVMRWAKQDGIAIPMRTVASGVKNPAIWDFVL